MTPGPTAMNEANQTSGYLQGQLLIAMPTMMDPRFQHTVIYMCAHSSAGAMGLVVNKPMDGISFPDLLQQLGIDSAKLDDRILVHFGGPVEPARGFVLHSTDYMRDGTMVIDDGIGLTATVDVLKAIAHGQGPRRSLLALGYAGWAPGQLDQEIQANGWLHAAADEDLVFGIEHDSKWPRAIRKVGFDPGRLSTDAGHA